MASNVVNVFVRADSSQLTRAFDSGATAGERFKARMGLVAAGIVTALAVKAARAVQDFVVDSIRAFSDLNESMNALEVTYGENAEGIKKLGREAAQGLGLSNAEFNSFAVSISNFAKEIAGDGGDVVGVVAEMTGRVSDFASVMNLDVAVAQEKFQSGLAGQSRPLREFGIDVSDARVKAFALANGIGEVGRELTEGEKVQARYGTIMEQTANTAGDFTRTAGDLANAERIANAELENSKALFGEILAPIKAAKLELQTGLITALAQLTGVLTAGRIAATEQGTAVEDLGDVFDSLRNDSVNPLAFLFGVAGPLNEGIEKLLGQDTSEIVQGFKDWADVAGFTDEELGQVENTIRAMGDAGTLTEEEMAGVLAVLEDIKAEKFSEAMSEDADAVLKLKTAAGQAVGPVDDLADSQEDLAEETESATDALKRQNDTLRALTDPAFALYKATQDLETAQDDYKAAVDEFKADSPEAIEAAGRIADAQYDLRDAMIDVGTNGIDPLRKQLQSLGIPDSTINAIIGNAQRIEEYFRNMVLRIGVSAPSLFPTRPASGGVGWQTETKTYFQRGGITTEGFLDGNRSRRKEAIVPLETAEGKRVLAAAIAEAMGGGGINITVYAGMGTNGHEVGEQIVEEIEKARRRGVAV